MNELGKRINSETLSFHKCSAGAQKKKIRYKNATSLHISVICASTITWILLLWFILRSRNNESIQRKPRKCPAKFMVKILLDIHSSLSSSENFFCIILYSLCFLFFFFFLLITCLPQANNTFSENAEIHVVFCHID